MKKLIYIVFAFFALLACEKEKTGYLEAEEASYDPDSMVIRKVLDPQLDADRKERQYPWVSQRLQGVLGTVPFNYKIVKVHSTDGDIDSFLKEVKLRGDSAFEIPLKNSVAPGKYVVDVKIGNQGGITTIREGLFTIIVK